MLFWALTFLSIAIVTGILSFTGMAAASEGFVGALFVISLVLFVITLVVNKVRNRRP